MWGTPTAICDGTNDGIFKFETMADPRQRSSPSLPSPLSAAPISESLLLLSEKSRVDRAKPAAGDAEGGNATVAAALHQWLFRALLATSTPARSAGTMWLFGQLVVGLQVRGSCPGCVSIAQPRPTAPN